MDRDVTIRLRFVDEASSQVSSAVSRIQSAFSGVTAAAGSVASKATGFIGGMVGGIKNHLTDLASHAKWASAIFGQQLLQGLSEVVGMAAKFERFGAAAKFLTGSTEEANKFAAAVREISKATMFNVDQIADMESRLVGNTKNVDLSTKALKAMTDAVAATGGGYSELEGVVRAWIQTNSKAKASAEEMNRQFANANIPMLRLLAESIVKDADHPLRKYLTTAEATGGANKTMTKSFQTATENMPILKKQLEAAEAGLKAYNEGSKKTTESTIRHQIAVDKARMAIDKANTSISNYSAAQGKANTVVRQFSVDEIMAQLQNIGDLDIPGKIAGESIIRALNEAYGGANLELVKTFDGQMSLLTDTLKLTALSFMGLDESFRPIKGGLLDILKSALTPLVTWLNDHQKDITNFAAQFGRSTPALMAFAGAIIGIVAPAIIGLLLPLIQVGIEFALIGAAIGFVIDRLGGFGKVSGAVMSFFQAIPGAIQAAKTNIEQFGNSLGIIKPLQQIGEGLQKTFAAVLPIVTTFFTALGKAFAPLGEAFSKAFQQVSQVMQSQFGPALQNLLKAFQTIAPVLGQLLAGLAIAFGAILVVVLAVVSGIINAFAAVLPYIVQIFSGIVNFVSGVISFLSALFTGNLGAAIEGLKNMFIGIYQVVTGIWNGIQAATQAFVMGIINFFVALYQALVGGSIIPDLVNAILMWFGNMISTLTGNIGAFISGVIDKFKQWGQSVLNTVSSTAVNVVSWITNMASQGVASFKNMFDQLYRWAESGKNQLTQIFQNIANAISGALGGLAGAAWGWGSGIVSGIINGIKQSLRNLAGSARDLANRIANQLGISFQHGGIVPGPIGSPVPIIAHAGERIVPAAGADVNPSGGMSGEVNINFYGGVTIDSEERIRELADRISKIMGRQSELSRYGAAV